MVSESTKNVKIFVEIRLLVLHIFVTFLTAHKESLSESSKSSTLRKQEYLELKRNRKIREFVYNQAQFTSNVPLNYQRIYEVLSLLLEINKEEELKESIPLIIKLQVWIGLKNQQKKKIKQIGWNGPSVEITFLQSNLHSNA